MANDVELTPPSARPHAVDYLKGRSIYLLIIAILLNVAYPLSERGTTAELLFSICYCGLYGLGVYTVARTRQRLILTAVGTFLLIAITAVRLQYPDNLLLSLCYFSGYVLFAVIIMVTLLEYIFAKVNRVTTDVLLAAITAYILIGDIFLPAYVLVDVLTKTTTGNPAFFVASGDPVTWQLMTYYSFVTLTTLGYGDITPLSSVARVVVTVEAVTGVLYIAFLVGRLVGLYAQPQSNVDPNPPI